MEEKNKFMTTGELIEGFEVLRQNPHILNLITDMHNDIKQMILLLTSLTEEGTEGKEFVELMGTKYTP